MINCMLWKHFKLRTPVITSTCLSQNFSKALDHRNLMLCLCMCAFWLTEKENGEKSQYILIILVRTEKRNPQEGTFKYQGQHRRKTKRTTQKGVVGG